MNSKSYLGIVLARRVSRGLPPMESHYSVIELLVIQTASLYVADMTTPPEPYGWIRRNNTIQPVGEQKSYL